MKITTGYCLPHIPILGEDDFNYLTIISLEDNNQISWKGYASKTISVSTDGRTWKEYTST